MALNAIIQSVEIRMIIADSIRNVRTSRDIGEIDSAENKAFVKIKEQNGTVENVMVDN